MDITKLKKIVLDGYAVTEGAVVIPRFSTQFTFTDTGVFVRIPIYECQPPPRPLLVLVCQVVNAALPHLKKKPEDLELDLLAAVEGKHIPGAELDILGFAMSTSVDGGSPAHAVTACHICIRQAV